MDTYYFDNAATTKVKKEVLQEMIPYYSEKYGNPSGVYALAREAKKDIESAREKVANLIGCDKKEIYFTASGSEADNTAIKAFAYKNKMKGNHIITTNIEHHAILESCEFLEKQGFKITHLNVDSNGFINLNELRNVITEKTILITIMFANNEIGTIEPIEDIAKIAKEKNIIFHTDAVQAVGNVKIDVKSMGIDMLSLSGHKIYGPKGIGALYVRNNVEFDKFINGGHQEKNKRAGTENTAGIVGLGKAAELANTNLEEHIRKVKELRDYYVTEIYKKIPNIRINGAINARLPGNSNISFEGVNGKDLLLELDNVGICASSGSACNSEDTSPSHVLSAIGLDAKTAKSALRVTFGEFNTKEEVDYLVENLEKAVKKLRNM
ncbi:MAG: cysteine desulfurase NifS [Clostridia bacterium]|nr:cysteine desulfurase NifS [Clostridia bacterium]